MVSRDTEDTLDLRLCLVGAVCTWHAARRLRCTVHVCRCGCQRYLYAGMLCLQVGTGTGKSYSLSKVKSPPPPSHPAIWHKVPPVYWAFLEGYDQVRQQAAQYGVPSLQPDCTLSPLPCVATASGRDISSAFSSLALLMLPAQTSPWKPYCVPHAWVCPLGYGFPVGTGSIPITVYFHPPPLIALS